MTQILGPVTQSLIKWEHQLTEVRASIFSLIAESGAAECPLPLDKIVTFAVAQHHVSETVAQSAIQDLVALGLVEIFPDGAQLTALSRRLAK